jgi:glycosyltransferase involved in cell wall biosynthesis
MSSPLAMGAARPRVLVVSFIAVAGGAHNLWRRFVMDPAVAARIDAHVLAPAAYRDADPDVFTSGERPFHRLTELDPPSLGARLLRRLGGGTDRVGQWRARFEAQRPAIVLFNLAGMGDINWCVDAGAACAALGLPYWLVLQHASEDFFFADDAATGRARTLVAGARRVLTVAERNRRSLERALGAPVPHAQRGVNGVTAAQFAAGAALAESSGTPASGSQARGTARLLCLARFDPAFKGQDLLLEALDDADWRTRDWHLTLQGGGPLEGLMRQLVARHGFGDDRVRIATHDPDVNRAFAASDLLVLPSRSEGTPFALVEAMACGRPAVVTPVGGNDELVREGETGWVAAAVTAEALRAALARAWIARPVWGAIGRQARKRVGERWVVDPAHQALLGQLLSDVGS